MVPWWSAARCLRRAFAAEPRWRRRLPGAGGKVVDVGVPVVGDGGEGDSSRSLMDDMPFLDKMVVKVAHAPASSSSSKMLRIFWTSAFIFGPDI